MATIRTNIVVTVTTKSMSGLKREVNRFIYKQNYDSSDKNFA